MIPIRKILCPTDFSEASYTGLQVANELAVYFSSELILVHVISPVHAIPGANLPGFDVGSYEQEMKIYSQKLLEDLAKNRIHPNITCNTFLLDGSPSDAIVSVAASEQVDLIVISTHGLSGFRRFIFGSVTEKVFRNAICPVLTVPVKQDEGES
jgi:universal stress protein A